MKRFTETQKWADPWFRKLSPNSKLLWQWMLDSCDNAGIIDLDLELASFQIGYAMGMDTLSELGERVTKLPCGKYFIPKFIGFQYGELSPECKAHNPVFASLTKHSVKGYGIGYAKGSDTLQEKEKEKDKDTEKAKAKHPTLDEVKMAMAKCALPESEAQKFLNYYESNGWRVGRNPMRSWQHAIGNWASNYRTRFGTQQNANGAPKTDKELLSEALG